MPWYIGTIIGSIVLATMNSIERTYGTSVKSLLVVIPLLLICNQLYWYGFHNAPNFMMCWFLGSAIAATLGWLSSIFILKEPYNVIQIIGSIVMIIGFIMMKIK